MIQDHAAAVLALLSGAGLTVYDGAVPQDPVTRKSPPPPYVVVYVAGTDPEQSTSTPLTGESRRHVLHTYCHSVGANQQAARIIAGKVRAALLDATPIIAGRRCFPIRHEDGQPAQRDESTGAVVIDLVDVYRLESVPT